MTRKTLRERAIKLKEEMSKRRTTHATITELILLLSCHNLNSEITPHKMEPMKKTNLYKKYGGEYCEYLELLA